MLNKFDHRYQGIKYKPAIGQTRIRLTDLNDQSRNIKILNKKWKDMGGGKHGR